MKFINIFRIGLLLAFTNLAIAQKNPQTLVLDGMTLAKNKQEIANNNVAKNAALKNKLG